MTLLGYNGLVVSRQSIRPVSFAPTNCLGHQSVYHDSYLMQHVVTRERIASRLINNVCGPLLEKDQVPAYLFRRSR